MLKRLSLIVLTVNALNVQDQGKQNEKLATIVKMKNNFEIHKGIENKILLQLDSDINKLKKRHSEIDDFNIMIGEHIHKSHHKHHHHKNSHQSKHHHHHST